MNRNKLEERFRAKVLVLGFIGIQSISAFHIAKKDCIEDIMSTYHPRIEFQIPKNSEKPNNSKTVYLPKEPLLVFLNHL